MKKILYIILIALLSVVAESVKATPLSGSGTETDPYIIATTADWTEFCDNHATYKNSYIKMANFVTAATNKYFNDTFSGTFDGDGYTLTVNISGGQVAPFMQVSNGTIKNLRVAGSITGSANHTSGLVCYCTNGTTCTIQNCIVSATITNTANLGGFIGHGTAATTINMTDCVFNGTLNYSGASNGTNKDNNNNTFSKKVGGFVSWEGNGTTIFNLSRCLFDGTINCTAGFTPFIVKYSGCNVMGCDAASCLYTVAQSSGFPAEYTIFDGTSAIGQTAEQIVTTMNNAGGNGWRVFKGKAEPTMRPLRTLGNIPDGWTVTANGDTITVTNGTAIITEGDTVLLFPPQAEIDFVKSVTLTDAPAVPSGAIDGLFSVSSTKQVYFSQGNLRAYNATANSTSGWVWSFAENQWDYIGSSGSNQYINGSMTISKAGYVDLFCWVGASASYDNYGIMYDNDTQGWAHEGTNFGNSTNDTLKHDWGHNPITNGGNVADMWRTPTNDEWAYLINSRTTAAGTAPTINGTADARYAKAKLFGTNRGLIIFPDTYVHPDGVAYPTGINAEGNTSWNGNQYSAADWAKMEAAGCVFLPCAGIRVYYKNINDKETRGFYASSTPTPGVWNDAKVMHFTETSCNPNSDRFRRDAGPVRLVQDAN